MDYTFHSLTLSLGAKSINKDIKVYSTFSELYNLCDTLNHINRLKTINQLGCIKVPHKLEKSRLEYIFFQLYLHNMVQKFLGGRASLTPSYSKNVEDSISIADAIQVLVLIYNLGHFHNTFVASRALLHFLLNNTEEKGVFKSFIEAENLKNLFDTVLEKRLYHFIHLFNSYILLSSFNQNDRPVRFAKDLLVRYIEWKISGINNIAKDYIAIFEYFDRIRSLAYIINDLQVSVFPLFINWTNDKVLKELLYEYFHKYNDSKFVNQILKGLEKILSDTIYNDENKVLSLMSKTDKIFRKCSGMKLSTKDEYIESYIIDDSSYFNQQVTSDSRYIKESLFKITIPAEYYFVAHSMYDELKRKNFVTIGYYKRNSQNTSIVIALNKNCQIQPKIAFKILRIISKYLKVIDIDKRYKSLLIAVKFFLCIFFDCYIELKSSALDSVVIMGTGCNKRVKIVKELLKESTADSDSKHEIETLIKYLEQDKNNDLAIIISASILLYDSDKVNVKKELDGMVIFPNRSQNQVVLFESKNSNREPAKAIRQLNKIDNNINRSCVRIEPAITFQGFDAIKTISIL